MPYSVEDICRISSECKICTEIKPRFHHQGTLIKAPFERLNMDFKRPLPSVNQNIYFLVLVDEYSRFPFAFLCSDMTSATVKSCSKKLFTMFGALAYIYQTEKLLLCLWS